jgi:hypothetical protein
MKPGGRCGGTTPTGCGGGGYAAGTNGTPGNGIICGIGVIDCGGGGGGYMPGIPDIEPGGPIPDIIPGGIIPGIIPGMKPGRPGIGTGGIGDGAAPGMGSGISIGGGASANIVFGRSRLLTIGF